MSIKTRVALAFDTLMDVVRSLLPFLPGDRNSPGSLEARVASAADKFQAKISAESQHLEAVVGRVEVKAQRYVASAATAIKALEAGVEQLKKSGLVK